jgi:hypothetical protein
MLVQSCKPRAVELGRPFARDEAKPAREVLHPRNFTPGEVEVYRLGALLDEDGDFLAQAFRAAPPHFW